MLLKELPALLVVDHYAQEVRARKGIIYVSLRRSQSFYRGEKQSDGYDLPDHWFPVHYLKTSDDLILRDRAALTASLLLVDA
jgi:hypothetical protein